MRMINLIENSLIYERIEKCAKSMIYKTLFTSYKINIFSINIDINKDTMVHLLKNGKRFYPQVYQQNITCYDGRYSVKTDFNIEFIDTDDIVKYIRLSTNAVCDCDTSKLTWFLNNYHYLFSRSIIEIGIVVANSILYSKSVEDCDIEWRDSGLKDIFDDEVPLNLDDIYDYELQKHIMRESEDKNED